jgi:hypothetical protein
LGFKEKNMSCLLPKTFHSSPTAYIVMWRGLIIVLGAAIIAATVLGQIKGGRFPVYRDLAISISLPFVAYAFLAALTYAGCLFFPVRLGPEGLKSTNMFGVPAFVSWNHIRAADFREIQGIPYIFIEAEGRSQPITVPVWLSNPKSFIEAVREYAGPQNPLTILIDSAEAQQAAKADGETRSCFSKNSQPLHVSVARSLASHVKRHGGRYEYDVSVLYIVLFYCLDNIWLFY